MNKTIKILFLAKYAPISVEKEIPEDLEDYVYAVYHHKIYETLCKEFVHVRSSHSIQEFVKNKPTEDYIFSLYNRIPFRNSEIFISSLAEYYGIPYLGAPPNIRAVAEDKHLAKINARNLKINTPEWILVNKEQKLPCVPFEGPYFVKPRFGATSRYIDDKSFCKDLSELKSKVYEYQTLGIDIIIEKYIQGTSITVPVLNNFGKYKVFPYIIESSNRQHNIITYQQKRKIEDGLSRTICKNILCQKMIETIAIKYFKSIQPIDYTRMDFIIDNKTQTPYFIEFNICCNLGEYAAINLSAQSIGINYQKLINNIVYSSLYRQNLINTTFGQQF